MLWVSANELIININKIHCISFFNDIEFKIVMNNKYLVQVSEIKFRGLIIDNSLNLHLILNS